MAVAESAVAAKVVGGQVEAATAAVALEGAAMVAEALAVAATVVEMAVEVTVADLLSRQMSPTTKVPATVCVPVSLSYWVGTVDDLRYNGTHTCQH